MLRKDSRTPLHLGKRVRDVTEAALMKHRELASCSIGMEFKCEKEGQGAEPQAAGRIKLSPGLIAPLA